MKPFQAFKGRDKRCAMGDLKSMMWMYQNFKSMLGRDYEKLETKYVNDTSKENEAELVNYFKMHENEALYFLGANMWLNRAALYGEEEAKELLEKYPFFRKNSYPDILFQVPGKNRSENLNGAVMRELGFPDFDKNLSYTVKSLNDHGFYMGECYVSYDGPDETGFGMEDYYDYYFFDEFFSLLLILRDKDTRYINNHMEEIQQTCEKMKEKKQQKRDLFWTLHKSGSMKKYQSLLCEKCGPYIMDNMLLCYFQNPHIHSGKAVIPAGVKKIGAYAFKGCVNIESIEIPDSIEKIEEYAFSGCENLRYIVWPRSMPVVTERAFFHCHELERVTLPNTVTEIQEGAFLGCKNLKEIVLPDHVVRIKEKAFMYCESLERIVLPDKLERIDDKAFYLCEKLKKPYVPPNVTMGEDVFYKRAQ